ncbi:hypothetical protein AAG570_000050 [Ranatra chinensis]|uniref:Uncharacterized protein n=1 Tax=Ranatra chinensis TaxID=642074 RepID=A0ABD0YVZ3_9HEMI
MASKGRNMFYQNKKQETTEIEGLELNDGVATSEFNRKRTGNGGIPTNVKDNRPTELTMDIGRKKFIWPPKSVINVSNGQVDGNTSDVNCSEKYSHDNGATLLQPIYSPTPSITNSVNKKVIGDRTVEAQKNIWQIKKAIMSNLLFEDPPFKRRKTNGAVKRHILNSKYSEILNIGAFQKKENSQQSQHNNFQRQVLWTVSEKHGVAPPTPKLTREGMENRVYAEDAMNSRKLGDLLILEGVKRGPTEIGGDARFKKMETRLGTRTSVSNQHVTDKNFPVLRGKRDVGGNSKTFLRKKEVEYSNRESSTFIDWLQSLKNEWQPRRSTRTGEGSVKGSLSGEGLGIEDEDILTNALSLKIKERQTSGLNDPTAIKRFTALQSGKDAGQSWNEIIGRGENQSSSHWESQISLYVQRSHENGNHSSDEYVGHLPDFETGPRNSGKVEDEPETDKEFMWDEAPFWKMRQVVESRTQKYHPHSTLDNLEKDNAFQREQIMRSTIKTIVGKKYPYIVIKGNTVSGYVGDLWNTLQEILQFRTELVIAVNTTEQKRALLEGKGSEMKLDGCTSIRVLNLVNLLFGLVMFSCYSGVLVSKLTVTGPTVYFPTIESIPEINTHSLCVSESSFGYVNFKAKDEDDIVHPQWAQVLNRDSSRDGQTLDPGPLQHA